MVGMCSQHIASNAFSELIRDVSVQALWYRNVRKMCRLRKQAKHTRTLHSGPFWGEDWAVSTSRGCTKPNSCARSNDPTGWAPGNVSSPWREITAANGTQLRAGDSSQAKRPFTEAKPMPFKISTLWVKALDGGFDSQQRTSK